MTKQDFENKRERLQEQLGVGFQIAVDYFTLADFVIGCYYDEEKKKWIMYENNERGIRYTRLETESEEEAYGELYSWIQFYIETEERLQRRREKN